MNHWLNRLREYWKDKILADKCGLEVKDICVHECCDPGPQCKLDYTRCICKKCGSFIDE